MLNIIINILFTATFIYGFIHLFGSIKMGMVSSQVYTLLIRHGPLNVKQLAAHLLIEDKDIFRACFAHPHIEPVLLGSYDQWRAK